MKKQVVTLYEMRIYLEGKIARQEKLTEAEGELLNFVSYMLDEIDFELPFNDDGTPNVVPKEERSLDYNKVNDVAEQARKQDRNFDSWMRDRVFVTPGENGKAVFVEGDYIEEKQVVVIDDVLEWIGKTYLEKESDFDPEDKNRSEADLIRWSMDMFNFDDDTYRDDEDYFLEGCIRGAMSEDDNFKKWMDDKIFITPYLGRAVE